MPGAFCWCQDRVETGLKTCAMIKHVVLAIETLKKYPQHPPKMFRISLEYFQQRKGNASQASPPGNPLTLLCVLTPQLSRQCVSPRLFLSCSGPKASSDQMVLYNGIFPWYLYFRTDIFLAMYLVGAGCRCAFDPKVHRIFQILMLYCCIISSLYCRLSVSLSLGTCRRGGTLINHDTFVIMDQKNGVLRRCATEFLPESWKR